MRKLVWLVVIGGLSFFVFTVDVGSRTISEHVSRIWQSEEAQEMVTDVKKASGPLTKKVKRGVKAGWNEFKSEDGETLEQGKQEQPQNDKQENTTDSE